MAYQKTMAIRDYLGILLRSEITKCIKKTMAIDRIVTCIFYDHVELSLQHITCDFKALQHHWNAPSQVWSITAEGPGYRPTYYPAHFIILTPGRPIYVSWFADHYHFKSIWYDPAAPFSCLFTISRRYWGSILPKGQKSLRGTPTG